MNRRIVLWVMLLLGASIAAMAQTAQTPPGERRSTAAAAPLPGDPLTAEETQRLERIGAEFAQARQGLGRERIALVGTELIDYKPPQTATTAKRAIMPEEAGRYGSVLFFDYGRNAGVRVIVDLGRNAGVSVTPIPPEAIPVGRAEVETAVSLALKDAGVARVVGDTAGFRLAMPGSNDENTVEGLRVLGAGPNDPCTKHRCIDLFFRRGGYYLAGNRFTVDLTSSTVRVTSANVAGARQ